MMIRGVAFGFLIGVAGVCTGAPRPVHTVVPSPQSYVEREGAFALRSERVDAGIATFTTDSSVKPEGYRLAVEKDSISVVSSDAAGAFYAVETLKQMARKNADGGWEIPCAEIDDRPQYGYRGIMIDESRHFFGKAFVLSLLDKMSRYKLNVLHWHLNDECGFRQPFDFDPKMAKEGATRPFKTVLDVNTGTMWDPDPNAQQEIKARAPSTGPDYGPYSYTKADVGEVLAFAAARHIRVIPELEVPGHATGLLRAHPEFTCLDADGRHLPAEECMEICVGNPDAIAWYDRAFDETFALFPDAIVHIGGDEVNPKHWDACPRCQAFMKEHGIKDWNGLQAWVTSRYADRIRRAGKRMAGWDEIYYQDAPKDTIIWCPSGMRTGCAAMSGYDVVRCDNEVYYFDWPQGLEDDPHQYIGWKPEVNTFAEVWLTRVSCELPEKCRDRVLGAEACLWGEFTRSPKELEWKIWPRAIALAENLWRHGGSPISGRYNDFKRRAWREVEWLRVQGVNCAPFKRD